MPTTSKAIGAPCPSCASDCVEWANLIEPFARWKCEGCGASGTCASGTALVTRAEMLAAMEAIREQIKADILNSMRRAGAFGK